MVCVWACSVSILLVVILQGRASRSSLTLETNCVCPGYTLTFAECTVKGGPGDVTVWKGSAFDCSNDEITLLHSLFGSNYTQSNTVAAGECNNGSIQAHSIRVEDNCYTSQLNITVNADMIGKTIKCAHDHQSTESIIGTLTVATEDPLPPPSILFISKADFTSRQVTFNWSRAVTECPDQAIHYNILASNCGSCPTTTNYTSVTCTNVQINGSTCTFAIQTVVCGFIAGNESNTIILHLGSPGQNNSECNCIGAIVSTTLFAIMFFTCVSTFTIIFLIMLVKLKKIRLPSFKQQIPAESNYEVVKHQKSSSGVIDMGKNIAYGQVHT